MNGLRAPQASIRQVAFRLKVVLAAFTLSHLLFVLPTYLVLHEAIPAVFAFFQFAFRGVSTALALGGWIIARLGSFPGGSQQLETAGWSSACYVVGLLVISMPIAIAWAILDRKRTDFGSLNAGLRVYARYALGLTLVLYGMFKVVPTQFGLLTPGELIRPFGQLSPMMVLWNFMATSATYTIFTGVVEVASGMLLFFRRTAMLGSLVVGAVLTNVFVMDISYDVRGAALVVVSLGILDSIILWPYVRPLFGVFVLGRPAAIPEEPSGPFESSTHIPMLKIALIVFVLALRVYDGVQMRREYSGVHRVMYGLYDVVSFSRNGLLVVPLATDDSTWKRVASDGRYGGPWFSVQFANGSVRYFEARDESSRREWKIRDANAVEVGALNYTVDPAGAVTLSGVMHGHAVRLELRRVDDKEFPLSARM